MPEAPSLRVRRHASISHSTSSRWCSENSAWPRLLLASSAIHCRFVDRFAGSSVPSRVARQWLSSRDAFLPSAGSRWARFPGVSSTMKALRLPAPHDPDAHGVRDRAPRLSPRSCSPRRSRSAGDAARARTHWSPGRPLCRVLVAWANTGSPRFPGGPSHASAKLQDPGRTPTEKPLLQAGAAPAAKKTRAPAFRAISGLTSWLQHSLSTLQELCRQAPARLASGWLAILCRAGFDPAEPLQ